MKEKAVITLSRLRELEEKEQALREIQKNAKRILVTEHNIFGNTFYGKTTYTLEVNQALEGLHNELESRKKTEDYANNLLKKMSSRTLIQRILNRPVK